MGDFYSYNNEVEEQEEAIKLPPSVEQMLNQICKNQRQNSPDEEVRRLLLSIGEEGSLDILSKISVCQIRKTFSGFIVFMAKKYYQFETQQFYQQTEVSSAESFFQSPQIQIVHNNGYLQPQKRFSSNEPSEQLDEPQGLLKNATSTGQSKEARLAPVCAGLSSHLQEYKSENAQLEELLVAERELSKSYEARIKELQKDLSAAKKEVSKAESSMAEALAAKNAEIEVLVSSTDALKKQAALSEGNLASLQANMESLMRNRELTETRMMQALREELDAAGGRAEEECAAHNATKKASMEREVELEHRALEASTALARVQRTVDERTAKASELEQKVALLKVECATLNQELQDMEARARRGQKKSSEEENQVLQAWQEVERARQGQREAESKLASLEAGMQKLRVETSAMKRDAEHYSRQTQVSRDTSAARFQRFICWRLSR
ncbi:golgin candidate 1-like [Nicotiana tabacum]|uniref:Golgin candidate 1-like n=1 Tax=Nicotiana tabacum TaxID=4097 RepID=A0A1S4DE23_TOBAC